MSNKSISTQNSSINNPDNREWVQLNVGLVRYQNDALPSARALFERLEPLVNHWRSNDLLHCFFFMRKPPDVRLRFLIKLNRQQAIAEMSNLMDSLQQEKFINLFFFSEYQPETERFGGLKAMQLVHQYFDTDTSIWLILDYLYRHNLSVISKDLFLLTVLNDLFTRAMPDRVSVLTVWQKLGALLPASSETTIPTVELLSIEALCKSRSLVGQEVDLLQQYTTANDTLVRELLNLQHTGQLDQDLADVLAAVAMFNFHRHGFDWLRSGKLIAAITKTFYSPFRRSSKKS